MHSYVSCLMHCVFATKGRRRLITPELQARLWPYLGGIARWNLSGEPTKFARQRNADRASCFWRTETFWPIKLTTPFRLSPRMRCCGSNDRHDLVLQN